MGRDDLPIKCHSIGKVNIELNGAFGLTSAEMASAAFADVVKSQLCHQQRHVRLP